VFVPAPDLNTLRIAGRENNDLPPPEISQASTSSSRDPILNAWTDRSEVGELDGELPVLYRGEGLSLAWIAGRLSQLRPAISARSGTINPVDARGEDRR
jgi:hypothetical protein